MSTSTALPWEVVGNSVAVAVAAVAVVVAVAVAVAAAFAAGFAVACSHLSPAFLLSLSLPLPPSLSAPAILNICHRIVVDVVGGGSGSDSDVCITAKCCLFISLVIVLQP